MASISKGKFGSNGFKYKISYNNFEIEIDDTPENKRMIADNLLKKEPIIFLTDYHKKNEEKLNPFQISQIAIGALFVVFLIIYLYKMK